MALNPASSRGSSGTVTSVAAADTSIVVGGTATDPTIATGTLDVLATDHPPVAGVPMNGQVLTGLGAGVAPGQSVRQQQLATAGPISSVFTRTGAVVATSGDYNAAQVTNAADKSSGSTQTFTGSLAAPAVTASGLTGATSGARLGGGTVSGAPVSGTWALGDVVPTQNGHVMVCTAAGTPGTWVDAGSVGNVVTSVLGRTGAVVATSGDYNAAQVTNAADKSSASYQTFSGGYLSSSAANSVGYVSGAGGAVTQLTSRSTGVTINKATGAITLFTTTGGSGVYTSMTVTNSVIGPTDTVIVSQKSGTDGYQIFVTNVVSGSFKLTYGTTGGNTNEAPVFNFAILRASNA